MNGPWWQAAHAQCPCLARPPRARAGARPADRTPIPVCMLIPQSSKITPQGESDIAYLVPLIYPRTLHLRIGGTRRPWGVLGAIPLCYFPLGHVWPCGPRTRGRQPGGWVHAYMYQMPYIMNIHAFICGTSYVACAWRLLVQLIVKLAKPSQNHFTVKTQLKPAWLRWVSGFGGAAPNGVRRRETQQNPALRWVSLDF